MSNRADRIQFERAPVVYTVAQVKFSTIESIAKKIPDLQDEFRKIGYPRLSQTELMSLTFSLNAGTPEATRMPRWEFNDKDRHIGVVVGKEAISFHTTHYTSFEDFCSSFSAALKILDTVVAPALIERIGLRYLDLIRASPSGQFDGYIAPGLLGLTDEDLKVKRSSCFVNVVGETELGTLSIRSMQRSDGNFISPDLLPMNLAGSHAPVLPGEKITTLDFDHACDLESAPIEFAPEDVVRRLWLLHEPIATAFYAATTAHARREWGAAFGEKSARSGNAT